ncbi:hypothetical protein [Deinococcus pimensis]|uniref:hypothetical protein n=1 Tax=Deinococcus pimensis TaxID=309888 RepID=UPI0004876CD5|nr:hypothetical protein [Deinococcus pimensis]
MIAVLLAVIPSAVALVLVVVLFGAAIVRALRGEFRQTELRWTPDLEGVLPDPEQLRAGRETKNTHATAA